MERIFLRLPNPAARPLAETPNGRVHFPRRESGLVESFCFHAFGFLHDAESNLPARRDALAFLAEQGFDTATLGQLPLGMVLSPQSMRERLLADGFGRDEIRDSKLIADQRLLGRLVGPIADAEGNILSFWARDPHGRQPKYLYWRGGWREHVAAFGLDAAVHAVCGTDEPIVLVEDLFETLLLRSRGLGSVAATGDAFHGWDARRWEQLAASRVRQVTIVADNRSRSGGALLAAIEASFEARQWPGIDVVPPAELGEARTPGRLVRAEGLEALLRLLRREQVPALTWKAYALLRKHRPRRGWTDPSRRAAMQEAVAFYARLSARRGSHAELDEQFVPPIVEALGWPWGVLGPVVRREGFCTLHNCPETYCFCFD